MRLKRWANYLVTFLFDLTPACVLAHLYMSFSLSALHQVFLNLVRLHTDIACDIDQTLVPLFLKLLFEVDLWCLFNRGKNLRLPIECFKAGIV